MCGSPECNVIPYTRWMKTDVPGTISVQLVICPACDTRRCQRKDCGENVPSRTAVICPRGHRL